MANSNVRLLPLDTPAPQRGYIPFNHSRYWRSPFEVGNPSQPGIAVFLTQKAYARANAHAHSDLNNEVGGWLIGSWREDQVTGEAFIIVEKCLPALFTQRGSAYLTFTQDSQVAMFDVMEDKFPDKELVGWYHTHPKMSVFLSNYDQFLHNHFFPYHWQVALVIEPHTNTAGFFIRDREGNLDVREYYGFYELAASKNHSVVRWANMEEVFNGSLAGMENDYE